MKRYSIIVLPLLFLLVFSCTKEFEELGLNTKVATKSEPRFLIPATEVILMDAYFTCDVNQNVTPVQAQYFGQSAYNDESRYTFRDGLQNTFSREMYHALKNLQTSKQYLDELPEGAYTEAEMNNYFLLITTLRVFAFQALTDWYGPIVYSNALNILNPTPAYDSQKDVYNGLLKELSDAIDKSVKGVNIPIGSDDLVYKGDGDKWIKFANSLLLRLAMRISDKDDVTAKSYVLKAAAEVISDNSENALLPYEAVAGNQNPYYRSVFSTRVELAASNTIINIQNATKDPRKGMFWAQPDKSGIVYGINTGSWTGYQKYAYPNPDLLGQFKDGKADLPGIFIDYAEVQFFLAEAALKGYIATSAEEHYKEGVKASIEYWADQLEMPYGNMVEDYLAQPNVTFDNTPELIGREKWIALWLQGPEAWAEVRRFDSPTLNAAPDLSIDDYPVRHIFPSNEWAMNAVNVTQAETLLGGAGDEYTTRLWWDVR